MGKARKPPLIGKKKKLGKNTSGTLPRNSLPTEPGDTDQDRVHPGQSNEAVTTGTGRQELHPAKEQDSQKQSPKIFGPFEVRFEQSSEISVQQQKVTIEKKLRPDNVVSFPRGRSSKSERTSQGKEIAQTSAPRPNIAPIRRYNCDNYQCCLELAAALNWESFTCLGCSGDINDKLIWKAHLAQKGDNIAQKLCDLPRISCHQHEGTEEMSTRDGNEFEEQLGENPTTSDAKRPRSAHPLIAKLINR